MKIATWNINSISVRLPHVLQWLEGSGVDVLALQETKCIDTKFPQAEIKEAGYHVSFCGQPTYNGVAILTKSPMTVLSTSLPNVSDEQRRFLSIKYHGMTVINVYVPNGQSVGSDKYEYKLLWMNALRKYIQDLKNETDKIIILGDFNVAPEDRDVHDPKLWAGHVLVSPEERFALQAVMQEGLVDAFRLFDQPEKIYSWWDYRQLAFQRNHGLRIDLVLLTHELSKYCKACHIDKTPRKWERPSDHTPVIVELQLEN